jgi:hypothetical protein
MSLKEKEAIELRSGLCASCKYSKIVRSERGSQFVMCLLSKMDPSFQKYPPLPVLSCSGYLSEKKEGG